MKILFIVNAKENTKSGLFIATHNRIKYLKENFNIGIEVYSLVNYKNFSNEYFYYENIKYNILYIKDTLFKSLGRKLGFDFYLKHLIENIKGINTYDLVVAHWAHPQGSLAYYINKSYKIPFTITLHGSDVHTMPYQNLGYKKFLKRNLNSADSAFFVSKSLMAQAKSFNSNSKNYISYNAIDSDLFSPQTKLEVKKFKDNNKFEDTVVGFVGDLKSIKRADWLIKIFESIQIHYYKAITFLIIGDGELRKQLVEESKKTDINVRLIGRVEQNSLIDYYNAMDCLILPSKEEGLGNVILEAQACGTPVVATNTGGISEVINNKFHLVKNQDTEIVKEITDKVNKILLNRYRSKNNASSWKEVVEKEMEIFRSIVNEQ